LILGRSTLPADDLNGLITWLKANPDKATQGTASVASRVAGALLQQQTGTRFQLVPYRGEAPAIQDLIGGQIDLYFASPIQLPLVRAGSTKAYAVAGDTRLALASDIPTVDEAGLPGFHVSVWNALWAPARTSPTIIAKVNAAVVDALADPSVRARLAALGQEVFPREQQTPQALAAFHKGEIEKWWPIIKELGIKGE
jgi:tripartite-type tricarboxylate transporter receptor subunit TctC